MVFCQLTRYKRENCVLRIAYTQSNRFGVKGNINFFASEMLNSFDESKYMHCTRNCSMLSCSMKFKEKNRHTTC